MFDDRSCAYSSIEMGEHRLGVASADVRFPLIWAILCVVAMTVIITLAAGGPASAAPPAINMAPGSMCFVAHC